ncbi:MAG: phosphohistidine phosphatase SixA [Candidatus Nitrosopolaris sp.]
MDLYLLRHGDAGRRISVAAGQDSGDVPLTIAGREEIAVLARSIKDLNLKFDAIITSPLKRAIQTAKIIAKVLTMEKRISIWNELVPEGNRSKLYNRLNQYKRESTILMVGHQPYLTNIIYDMIFQKRVNQLSQINLKKAGLAKIRVISLTPNISGELRWLLTPRILKSLAKDGSKSKSSAAYKKKEKVSGSNKG